MEATSESPRPEFQAVLQENSHQKAQIMTLATCSSIPNPWHVEIHHLCESVSYLPNAARPWEVGSLTRTWQQLPWWRAANTPAAGSQAAWFSGILGCLHNPPLWHKLTFSFGFCGGLAYEPRVISWVDSEAPEFLFVYLCSWQEPNTN